MSDAPQNSSNQEPQLPNVRMAPPTHVPQSEPEVMKQPATSPQTVGSVSYAPSNAQKSLKNWMMIKVGGIIFAVLFTAIAFLYVRSMQPAQISVSPTPTPVPIATPTPIRTPSRISTSSAFMNFQGAVASLSASLNGFDVSDTTLTPPVLVTDLGLTP